MPNATCSVSGCDKPTRSGKAALCKMHYHRQYRHGSVDKTAIQSGVSATHGRRYLMRYVGKTHPLADRQGRAYEHRVVLYDTIGQGPHPCYWCGTELDWLPKGDPACLHVDHLNGWGDDNRPENLVPSCCRCNTARGGQARSAALREAGWWSQHDTVAALRGQARLPRVEDQRGDMGQQRAHPRQSPSQAAS